MKGCVKAAIETEQIDTKEKDAYTSDIETLEKVGRIIVLVP